jgi:hypothetical protein
MRHRAARILPGNLTERRLGSLESEGMQQGNTTFEVLLHFWIARSGEVDGPQLLFVHRIMLVLAVETGRGRHNRQNEQEGGKTYGLSS